MLDRSVDEAIVSAAIQLGTNLGLSVTAEGVESEKVLDRLRELGCHNAQGYAIAAPMPAAEATRRLALEIAGAHGAAALAAQ